MEERSQPVGEARVLSILGMLGQEFASVVDLPRLCLRLVSLLNEEAGYRNCSLFLANGKNNLTLAAAVGYRSQGEHPPLPDFFTEINNTDIYLMADRMAGTDQQDSSRGIGSLLAVRLRSEERLIGVILLEDERPGVFTQADSQILKAVAPHLARALEIAQHYQKLQEAALVDELTGVKNRRFFQQHLEIELARAQRNSFHLSVVIIDIDRLKGVNDLYGHQAGDRSLKILAQLLRQNTRPYDEVARYGGDEFVLALPEASPGAAEYIMNRLVLVNDRARLDYLHQQVFLPSFSYGVATFPQDGKGAEELLAVADQRLYQAKAKKGIS